MSDTCTELVARIATLEDEAEIARRLAAFADHGAPRQRIYRFIETEAANFAVVVLCRVCRIGRSAYYAWAAKGEGPDEALVDEAYLANTIFDTWATSRRRYGVPRVTATLWRANTQVNPKKVARIMAELGIAGISGRRKLHTTWRDRTHSLAPDLVGRDFSANAPDQLWCGDLTYIPTDEGWLYVTSVLDVFSRRLIGWSITEHMRTECCIDAIHAASTTRGRAALTGTIFHSDHGCQYTSEAFKQLCLTLGIVQSMGTVGDSYDNAMAESLWASLKRELVDEAHYRTRKEARIAIFEWIMWYNRQRLHSSLGYMPPEEFEEAWQDRQAA